MDWEQLVKRVAGDEKRSKDGKRGWETTEAHARMVGKKTICEMLREVC